MENKWKVIIAILLLFVVIIFLANFKYTAIQGTIPVLFYQYNGQPYNSGSWWDDKIISSDTAIIGSYKFYQLKKDQVWHPDRQAGSGSCAGQYCNPVGGGCNYVGGCSWVCNGACHYQISCYIDRAPSYVADIYKNNILINRYGYDGGCGSNQTGQLHYEDEGIDAYIDTQESYVYGTFYSSQSSYYLKIPENALNFYIVLPEKTEYITGENATIRLIVSNNFADGLVAETTLQVCQPVWYGKACQNIVSKVNLTKGNNSFDFKIPTNFVVNNLEVTPSVNVWLDLSSFGISGVNTDPINMVNDAGDTCSQFYGGRRTMTNVQLCISNNYKYVKLGTVTGETVKVNILPETLKCNTDSDCSSLSTCSGIVCYCGNDYKCHCAGSCISQPVEKVSIWQYITNTWNQFWSWVLSSLGWL